jgi:hypothetical protein
MADPENQALRLLRDIRDAVKNTDENVAKLNDKVDRNQADLRARLDNLRQAAIGESVLGRYTVAEVEERLDALETRVKALEGRR